MKNSYVQKAANASGLEDEWGFETGPPLFIKNDDPSAPSAVRFRFLALGPEGIKLADSFDGFVDIFPDETDDSFSI
jgi:hypothetical protein